MLLGYVVVCLVVNAMDNYKLKTNVFHKNIIELTKKRATVKA